MNIKNSLTSPTTSPTSIPDNMTYGPEFSLGLLHIPSSHGIVLEESFDRTFSDETMQIGQQNSPNLRLHVSTTQERRKTEPSCGHIFKFELDCQEFSQKNHPSGQRVSPEDTEMDTPALTYLTTPSTAFPHDTPLFGSPVDSVNSPCVIDAPSRVPAFAGLESCPSDVKPPTGKFNRFDALGLFQYSETCDTSARTQDEGHSLEATAPRDVALNRERSVMNPEVIQDIFSELWKLRRPKDCRVFFQALRLCHLNGPACPSCKKDSLVGSYQCATTMKPFPQASIDALLRRPSGERRSAAQKNTQNRVTRSLAQNGSAYPLSGPLPYLHPITTLEVCVLCITEGCTTRELKKIDRADFTLPLQDVNYHTIFRGLLFKEDPYDGLFDDPATL